MKIQMKNIFTKLPVKQTGAALIVVLMLMIIASTATIAIANRSTVDVRIANNDQLSKEALMVAEAGLMQTFQVLENFLADPVNFNPPNSLDDLSIDLANGGTGVNGNALSAFNGFGNVVNFNGNQYRQSTFNGNNFFTRIVDNIDDGIPTNDTDEKVWINTIGTVDTAQREIWAFVKTARHNPGIHGGTSVNVITDVDSLDPITGLPGDDNAVISSNNVVTVGELFTVSGDVESVDELFVSGSVTGDVEAYVETRTYPVLNPLNCPVTGAAGGFYDKTLGGLTYADGSIVSNSHYNSSNGDMGLAGAAAVVHIAPGDYCIDNLSITGAGQLIADTSGLVNLYVSGDINLAGNGITNTSGSASNLKIISTNPNIPGATISLSGTAETIMDLYAPTADIDFTGTASFTGRIIGDTVEVGNNGGVTIDPQLTRNRNFVIKGWREVRN